MSQFLLFQLYAPLLSWGEAAIGETRHTNLIPSRSALLGLLAAALGIRRDEEEQLNLFNQHYQVAVRPFVARSGWLRDYHTIQMPKENKKLSRLTRRDELCFEPHKLETILSSREYRTDAYYHIVISDTAGAPYSLLRLQQALQQPVFPLYLGRKCCPLALPLSAQIIEGTLREAFAYASQFFSAQLTEFNLDLFNFIYQQLAEHYYWQQTDADGFTHQQTQIRGDSTISRQRWQFTMRAQYSGRLTGGE